MGNPQHYRRYRLRHHPRALPHRRAPPWRRLLRPPRQGHAGLAAPQGAPGTGDGLRESRPSYPCFGPQDRNSRPDPCQGPLNRFPALKAQFADLAFMGKPGAPEAGRRPEEPVHGPAGPRIKASRIWALAGGRAAGRAGVTSDEIRPLVIPPHRPRPSNLASPRAGSASRLGEWWPGCASRRCRCPMPPIGPRVLRRSSRRA